MPIDYIYCNKPNSIVLNLIFLSNSQFMDFIKEAQKRVIKTLYDWNAVKVDLVNKFQLKGGFLSPVFVDAGVLESTINTRGCASSAMLALVHDDFKRRKNRLDVDAAVGVVSGGISWAASLANCDAISLLRAHAYPKDHGLKNQIDGELPFDGAKVVVIDDVITSGKSVLSVVDALRTGKNGKRAEVLGVYTIFDWCFPSVDTKFEEAGVEKKHLISFKDLLDYGFGHGKLPKVAETPIREFYEEHC